VWFNWGLMYVMLYNSSVYENIDRLSLKFRTCGTTVTEASGSSCCRSKNKVNCSRRGGLAFSTILQPC